MVDKRGAKLKVALDLLGYQFVVDEYGKKVFINEEMRK